jgi:hypothetical protein
MDFGVPASLQPPARPETPWSQIGVMPAIPPALVAAKPAADTVAAAQAPKGAVPAHLATAKGQDILIDGKPFHFQGLNVYDLADIAEQNPEELRQTLKTIAWSGATVVRFWAFSYLKPDTLGRILDESKALGLDLKFIPVLGNHWQHSRPELKIKDADWYRQGYKEQYRPHVERTVTALADRPEILMWELMNEPECQDGNALYAFTKDVSTLIRSKAPQLISAGTLSDDRSGLQNERFQNLHALPTIDVVSFHDYPEYGATEEARAKQLIAVNHSMAHVLDVGRKLGKPVLIGETGSKVTTGYKGQTVRDVGAAMTIVTGRVEKAMNGGAAGTLSWGPQPRGHAVDGDGYGFDFTPDSPAGEAVRGRMVRSYPTP